MQVTNIFIARHGETEYNRTHRIQGRGINKPLNATGQQQARAIGKALRNQEIDQIFSSSLARSIETAEIIAGNLKLKIESYPELDEMDFGIIEGQPIGDIEDDIQRMKSSWESGDTTFAMEDGESPEEVLTRVSGRMDALLEAHVGENVLFVLHGRLIRILLSHWLEYGLSGMHRVPHQNGALYHLRLLEKNFEPIYLNEVGHLNRTG